MYAIYRQLMSALFVGRLLEIRFIATTDVPAIYSESHFLLCMGIEPAQAGSGERSRTPNGASQALLF